MLSRLSIWIISFLSIAGWGNDCILVAFQSGKAGYIDSNGVAKVHFQFEDARNFSEGRAAVRKNGSWGFISRIGAIAVPFEYASVSDFSFSFAAARTRTNWLLIDLSGKEIGRMVGDNVSPWAAGIARVGTAPDVRLVSLK